MNNQVYMITGANNGFGFEASKQLAQQGATVVMVCRSRERGENARQLIAQETGNTPDLLLADLVSQAQVKRLAGEFRARYDRLDVLVNNAGFAYTPREESDEGFEKTFALNYLAYVTLTLELLPVLLDSAPARVINTASEAHREGVIDFDNLQGEQSFPPGKFGLPAMYGWTNLYRIMFTYTLAERLDGTGVVANTFCPGFVPVQRSSVPRLLNMMMPLMRLMPSARTPAQAAADIVYLATSAEMGQRTGLYFSSGEQVRSADMTYDEAVRERLWQHTLDLLGYESDPLTAMA